MGPAAVDGNRGCMLRRLRTIIGDFIDGVKTTLEQNMPLTSASLLIHCGNRAAARPTWRKLCRAWRGRLFFHQTIWRKCTNSFVGQAAFVLQMKCRSVLGDLGRISGALKRRELCRISLSLANRSGTRFRLRQW